MENTTNIMKKLFVTIAVIALSAGLSFAQDLSEVTDLFNNAATALNDGSKADAFNQFNNVLNLATALGEEGKDIVEKCQELIPQLAVSLGKDLIKAEDYDGAVAKLKEAVEIAKKFNAEEALSDAQTLIPQVLNLKGADLIKEKNYTAAADVFKEILAADPTDGKAAVRLGQALNGAGDADGALEAFKTAAANGQEATTNKQIANIFLKKSSAALKTKNYQAALDAAVESINYNPSANAYKVAGTSAMNLKKNADAIKYLSKYLEASPSAADAAQIKAAIDALKK